MLVLSRKIGERIVIEPGIEIAVVDVHGGRVRLGIAAPDHVGIRRSEVPPRVVERSSVDREARELVPVESLGIGAMDLTAYRPD